MSSDYGHLAQVRDRAMAEPHRPLPKDAQVRMCGNSVCPPLAAALVRANYRDLQAGMRQVA